MNTLRYVLLGFVPVAIVAAAAIFTYRAVTDDGAPDLSEIRVEPGRVSCDMFQVARGYRYHTVVVLDLKQRPEGVDPGGDPDQATPFMFTQDIVGDVQGTEAIYANVVYPEATQQQEFIAIGDTIYRSVEQSPWEPADLGTDFQVPYVPGAMCNAIAPDLFFGEMEGTPEFVNGISARKYTFEELRSDFPDRHPSFGPSSDAAQYVNVFQGDIWVADVGGYVVKVDLVGIGEYPNGRQLEVDYYYELYDVNAKIEIKPPI